MKAKGFNIPDGDAAIVPVMLYDAKLAQNLQKNDGKRRLRHRFLLSSSSEKESQN
jgi:hypothetical protein